MMKKPLLVITPGDPEGIGPEVVWKAIRAGVASGRANLLCVGAEKPFTRLRAPVVKVDPAEIKTGKLTPPSRKGPFIWLLPAPVRKGSAHLAGFQSGWSIQVATELVRAGLAQALVTGPISKERLQRGGYVYDGHTEFLAKLCGVKSVTMMLANDTLRISLVTTHLALKDVPSALTADKLRRAILHTVTHLRDWWGIKIPKVAVAALNPHAGEAGLFGDEEIRVISPEIARLQRELRGKCRLMGPEPADTLFAKHVMAPKRSRYDAVVCMYHDQGLIPVKLLDFPNTVNVTLGLPIVRTSVDHGVGFDIAWKNKADPSSLGSAIDLALQIVSKRK